MRSKEKPAAKPRKAKILIWDIETAGVQGLCADRGFVVCFGYKWLGDSETHCLTLLDYPGKDKHDDSKLLAAAQEIWEQADHAVAHYGDKFDKPYVEARLMKAGLPPLPNTRTTDTCLIARHKLRLSSNRLGNLAEFFEVKVKKMDKRGGWPDWWMKALYGDEVAIKKMAVYCKQDVDCLEGVYLKMRPIIPDKYIFNAAVGESTWTCVGCGGHQRNDWGYYFSQMKVWKRYRCKTCKRPARSQKAIGWVAKEPT